MNKPEYTMVWNSLREPAVVRDHRTGIDIITADRVVLRPPYRDDRLPTARELMLHPCRSWVVVRVFDSDVGGDPHAVSLHTYLHRALNRAYAEHRRDQLRGFKWAEAIIAVVQGSVWYTASGPAQVAVLVDGNPAGGTRP